MSTSLPRDFRARSNVINFKPATAVKVNMYASAQTFGERLGTRERAHDILWTLTSQDIHRRLVVERKWSSDRYEQWLDDTLVLTLLKSK
jgi:hypothetical protein